VFILINYSLLILGGKIKLDYDRLPFHNPQQGRFVGILAVELRHFSIPACSFFFEEPNRVATEANTRMILVRSVFMVLFSYIDNFRGQYVVWITMKILNKYNKTAKTSFFTSLSNFLISLSFAE
jgi:hypothetical protein